MHLRPRRTTSLDLNPDELECARAIFEKLQAIPRLSGRAPRLCHRGSDQYELEYPDYRLWKLAGDSTLPELTTQDIHSPWCIILSDIHQLHDAHIPYAPDIKTLSVVKKRNRATLVPFIDTFDFGRHVDDEAGSWADIKNKRIEIIKAQFEVLERLAQSRDKGQSYPTRIDPHPDIVVEVL